MMGQSKLNECGAEKLIKGKANSLAEQKS